MAIGHDKRLTNTTHVSLFPPSWGTLYQLPVHPRACGEHSKSDCLPMPQ